ncbi:GNAT family N-acetyltransferase [Kribbella qitaiheensis]
MDGHPVGMQDLIGVNFSTFGTVTSFSWLVDDQRGRGLGHEMRAAILHLAFDGLGAKEASSDAFVDNHGSNAISRDLGYEPNGSDWATRQGEPALLNRWRLTRDNWEQRRRDNIRLDNIEACRTSLPLVVTRSERPQLDMSGQIGTATLTSGWAYSSRSIPATR